MSYINKEEAFDLIRSLTDRATTKAEYAAYWKAARALDTLEACYIIDDNANWIITENGCVITCPRCSERLELCYHDGTEVRYLPHCPWCGKQLNRGE